MKGPQDHRQFADAMRDVRPLDDRTQRVEVRQRRSASATQTPKRIEFEIDAWGDHQQGRRRGTDERSLRRLELGDYPPELHLDLHGLGEDEARTSTRDALRRALKAGLRCVRIVHGRGLRSPAGPVLKQALPAWLAQPPHGRQVLAFTTAGEYGAAGGATLVLLRRKR